MSIRYQHFGHFVPPHSIVRLGAMVFSSGLPILVAAELHGKNVTLSAADLLLPGVLLALLATLWKNPGIRALVAQDLRSPIFATIGLFIAVVVLSAFFTALREKIADMGSIDPYVVKKVLGLGVLATFVAAGFFVGLAVPRERLVRALLYMAIAAVAVGFLRLCALPADPGSFHDLPYGYRLLGLTHGPNLFALQQAPIVIFALDYLVSSTVVESRPAARPDVQEWLIAIATAGIWLSGSRTATLGFAAALAALLVLRRSRSLLIMMVRVLILSFLVAASIYGLFSLIHVLERFSVLHTNVSFPGQFFVHVWRDNGVAAASEMQGIDHRAYIQERALSLFLQNPITGIGIGQFYLGFLKSGDPLAAEIHNTGLWIATELGLVGLAVTVALAALLIRAVSRCLRLASSVAPVALITFYIFASFASDVAYQRIPYFFVGLFWAYACLWRLGPSGSRTLLLN